MDLLQRVEKSRLSNRERVIHPLFVRVTHWINAFAAIAIVTLQESGVCCTRGAA